MLHDSAPDYIRILYVYAQNDKRMPYDIDKHLNTLKDEECIITQYIHNIIPGTKTSSEINKNINTANIIVLIVTVDFICSNYYDDVKRCKAEGARVIPILARPVDMPETLSELQPLPSNGKSISEWARQDAAFLDIAQGIRKVVDELRAIQREEPLRQEQSDHQDKSSITALDSNPFFFNLPLSHPKEFHGRRRACITLLDRTLKAASTSIVGPRLIGKTWLMRYTSLIAPQELGSKYRIGYLDVMAPRCFTVANFVAAALEALGLPKRSCATAQDSLILFQEAVDEVSSEGKVPVLCLDEFEKFGNHSEFNLDFFSSLRATAQNGLCLIVASKTPLINIVGEYGETSGFFNIFQQVILKPFDQREAECFVHGKGKAVGLTAQECEKLLQYGQCKGEYWPISLQLAGKTLIQDKTLAQCEQDSDYYRPADQTYWEEFQHRLQEVYQGIML